MTNLLRAIVEQTAPGDVKQAVAELEKIRRQRQALENEERQASSLILKQLMRHPAIVPATR